MNTITVTTACGKTKEFENSRDAEKGMETHTSLCEECDEEDIQFDLESESSSREERIGDGNGLDDETPQSEALPTEIPDSVRTDPLDIVPEYMVTEVEGQPTINKRGYAVIANHFDIAVRSEALTLAGETDHEYAEFKATAWKQGTEPEQGYTGHATARASEGRRGIENNLNEMAETRAMKRAVAWASGMGILAWEEMVEFLDG